MQHLAVALAAQEKRPLESYLIAAIKAEYTTFSSQWPGIDFTRPGAYVLGAYFAELGKIYGPAPAASE